jgi:site-specific DNA-methyltransferase (adenine-specific)
VLEDAGFEIRDMIAWCYYSGFPKSLDISKAIDSTILKGGSHSTQLKETEQEFGLNSYSVKQPVNGIMNKRELTERKELEPQTEEAQRWAGWGTALKPAYEPAILARKPIEAGSIARQVLSTGTGAINIDECRFGYGDPAWIGPNEYSDLRRSVAGGNNGILGTSTFKQRARNANEKPNPLGRWPANIYQCPKASRTEREQGLEHLEAQIPPAVQHQMETKPNKWKEGIKDPRAGAGRTASEVKNIHPTVKPLGLMRWLCRLITPKGGTVLDPFSGSGSTLAAATLEGFDSIGCELTAEYVPIIEGRIKWAREEYFNLNAQLDIPW